MYSPQNMQMTWMIPTQNIFFDDFVHTFHITNT